jgi:hypothetical protein
MSLPLLHNSLRKPLYRRWLLNRLINMAPLWGADAFRFGRYKHRTPPGWWSLGF